MKRSELSQKKLERLEEELNNAIGSAYDHVKQANGQPMNDKRSGAAFFSGMEKKEQRIFDKMHEIEKQKETIAAMQSRESRQEMHLSSNWGLKTCVQNIGELKLRKQDKATRDKIKMLEEMLEKANRDSEIMTDNAKSIVESGAVKQWEDKPIYYFVRGLQKVAFVIDSKTGEFILSKKYPAETEDDIKHVQGILNRKGVGCFDD